MEHTKRLACCFFIALAIQLYGAGSLPAQEFRATILGRVLDPSGAAIAGATVIVTNEQTNVTAKTVSEGDGAYNVPFLIPGRYRLEIDAQGFRKFVQSGITVEVNQKATVNVQMQIGALSEAVNVNAEATLLDTATGGLGQVIQTQKVESMPLNGRMIFMLNQLAVGVIWQVPTFGATGTSGLRPFDNLGGSAWSLNGGRVQTNEYLIDGAPDSTRGRYNFSPPVDAVQEFKVQTNTFDANYGRTGGGVINLTLKSGTNKFHGTLWEFNRYGSFDANNPLNKALGRFGDQGEIAATDPRFGKERAPRPPHQFNQFGGLIDGPVIKDKLFFMFSYENLRERVPFPITTSVPTLAERNGDFTQTYVDQTTALTIYDPLTTRSVNGNLVRDPFPGNKIPQQRMNPIALQILQLYPLPNVLNQRQNNFVNPLNKGTYNYDAQVYRADYQISEKHKIFGEYYKNHRDEFRSNNGLQGTFANQGQWPQTRNNHGGVFDWVYTVNPTTLINVRFGFTRFLETFFQTDIEKFDRTKLGFRNLPGLFLPVINLEQFTSIGISGEGHGTVDNTGSIQANLSRTFQHHTMKVGMDYRNIRSNPATAGASNGTFSFSRAFTRKDPNSADSTSGDSIASLLLGYPSGGAVGAPNARSMQWNYWALYVQDDYRVSRKLTLNLGLRWDYEQPVTERYDRLVRGFAFGQTNPLASSVANAPGVAECPACVNLQGGLLFAGVKGVPRGLFNPDHHDFQPRLGFAYSVNDKTVMRGGFGRYYAFSDQFGSQNGFFVDTPYIASDLGGKAGVPELGVNTFGNPFPNGLATAPGSTIGLLTQVGQGLSFDNPTRKLPYIDQYNFGFQRELTHNLIVEVAYVGSQIRHLAVGKGINEISAADLAKGATFLQQSVTNPFAGLLPGSSINGRTVQRQQLLRPFPEFQGITENALSFGKSWYNSLQVRVEKRLSSGLSFISSYTLSKEMEQNNFLNAQDTTMVRQLVSYDRTHRWVTSFDYDFPFGYGKKVLDKKGVLNQVVGGWQIHGIWTMQSGVPLGEPDLERLRSAKLEHPGPDRYFNTCYLTNKRDSLGNRIPAATCLPGDVAAWFQRDSFTLRTTPNRFSDIRSPWKPTLDLSLFKQFRITERVRLQYRLESFNSFNTVIWAPPSTDFTNQNFGKIAQPRAAIYPPRNIQMGLKLYF